MLHHGFFSMRIRLWKEHCSVEVEVLIRKRFLIGTRQACANWCRNLRNHNRKNSFIENLSRTLQRFIADTCTVFLGIGDQIRSNRGDDVLACGLMR